MTATSISDERLLAALIEALRQEGKLIARIVLSLCEIEERRIHLAYGYSSLFEFCVQHLKMSEGQAFYRTAAVKLAARFSRIREAIRDERVSITNLVLLRDLFRNENVDELLAAAVGKTKKEVQVLIAKLAPKPDVRSSIVRLPDGSPSAPVIAASTATITRMTTTAKVESEPSDASLNAPLPRQTPPPIAPSAQLQPLSEARHKVQFTASTMLREKLERAQSLMRHRNVDGDLAVVVERALDLLIAKLEKEKLAAASRPTSKSAKPCEVPSARSSASIAAATKRNVVRRDAEQCTFVGADGRRCAAKDLLELDHRHPRALGGSNEEGNIRLLCRGHNQYEAERAFGRDHIARAIRQRRIPRTPAKQRDQAQLGLVQDGRPSG